MGCGMWNVEQVEVRAVAEVQKRRRRARDRLGVISRRLCGFRQLPLTRGKTFIHTRTVVQYGYCKVTGKVHPVYVERAGLKRNKKRDCTATTRKSNRATREEHGHIEEQFHSTSTRVE